MEPTTEKTVNGEQPMTMKDAARLAAEHAIETGDPPPKKGREKLACKLSADELVTIGRRALDLSRRLKRFDEETKSVMAKRKADRLAIENAATAAADAFERGEEDRTIEYVEYVSLRQNRRWRERLDVPAGVHGREYGESALTDRDRQALLPNVEQGVLDLGGEKDEAEITDPSGVLAAAESEPDPSDTTLDNEPGDEGDDDEDAPDSFEGDDDEDSP